MTDSFDIPRDSPIILFDGICNLCSGTVQFIINRDPSGTFRFASLQSRAGQTLLTEAGLDTDSFDSFVLIENGEIYTKSDAAFRVASKLQRPWSLLSIFRFIPRPIRNAVYDLVANTRYNIFGKKDHCMIPTPERRERFLDEGIEAAK